MSKKQNKIKTNTNFYFISDPFNLSQDPFSDYFFDKDDDNVVECECGSAKIYGENTNLHSFWCAKHKDNIKK